MKLFILVLTFTTVLSTALAQRTRTIDVKHIALDLHFDWKKKQATGTATITLSLLDAADTVKLDAGMLTIHSVSLHNGASLKFDYNGGSKNDGLAILLDRRYDSKDVITLKIEYNTNWINSPDPNSLGGSFGKGLRFFEPTASTPIKRKQIWSQGEAECSRFWFPCYDSPDDLRTTEFKATVEQGLTVVSNGTLVAVNKNANGTNTFHYSAEHPYPNYLTSFVVGEYVQVKQQFGATPLVTYCYPDEEIAAKATVARLPDMVKFFSEKTEVPYPYSSYSQVVVQDYPFPSLVGQHTVSTISDNMIDDFSTHADFLYLWDGVESNALASQWFGNLIAPQNWNDIWLAKSFAYYFEGLYTDNKNGHDEYLMWYHPFSMGATLGDWNSGYRHPLVTTQMDDLENFVGDNYAKLRGALVLRMLQKQLGEEKWWKSVRYFTKTYAGKLVTTKDFQESIKVASGESMDWFFDQWVYGMGHPVFNVTNVYDRAKKQLVVTLKQLQQVDPDSKFPQTVFFRGSIEIEIDQRIETVWIKPQAENVFTFECNSIPKLVQVDFENTWIKELTHEKSFDEWLYQFQHDRDILGKNLAMTELVKLAKSEKTANESKQKIHNAFHQVISGSSYWRLRSAAIGQLNGILSQPFDDTTCTLLQQVTKKEKSWLRASAISALGNTKNEKFADLYIHYLNDSSERVVASAANALGKSKSSKAYEALVKLKSKPSWKNQSLMNTLSGLSQLGDPRGASIAVEALADNHSPRWFLGNFWDYPFIAAQTLASLGKGSEGYLIIRERFMKSIAVGDMDDIFQNVLLVTTLADPRGKEIFEMLKEKYQADENVMTAVKIYEEQFIESLSK